MVLPVRNDDGEGTPQNSISFQQITDEFGNPTQNKFGAYRVSQNIGGLSNLPLDDGIPQSGEIKFSDFYSKKLNVVVNCHSGPAEDRVNARDHKWANDNVDVIGDFKGKKIGGSKIIIHVNKQISSTDSGNQNTCALRTGNFNTAHSLQVDIGAEGSLHGAGGAGGNGADGKSDHGPTSGGGEGGDGNSALGITYNGTTVNVLSGGKILCGYGGGAGGRGARDVDAGADRTACGGGGGGGMGIPGGAAGEGGERLSGSEYSSENDGGEVDSGSDGGAGSATAGGGGGEGGDNKEEAKGQDGGAGGDSEQSPGSATGGKDVGSGEDPGVNANPGSNGAAIRRTSGYTVTINKADGGTIEGATDATGVA